VQTCLVQTTSPIDKPNPLRKNAAEATIEAASEAEEFPAFKSNPVLIAGFLPEATIMISKEKPKKIGIIGTNK
jgi:phosphatidylinositol kinase/protein kinase (PI-3  family)